MRRFRSWDGIELAFQVVGSGPPLVCIPGGPGQAVEYLGVALVGVDLGVGQTAVVVDAPVATH